MMTRTRSFVRNTWVAAFYQMVVMLVSFVLPKVMLSYYGSEINGLVTSITQFINYITLVEAGLSGAAVYALYKPLADGDHREISRVVVATKNFYTKSGWIFVGLVALLALVYPLITSTASLSPVMISSLVLVVGVSGTLDFFFLGKYRAILTADQKQFVISFASLTYYVLNTVLLVVLAVCNVNIVTARIIALCAVFARSLILSLYCKKHYSYLDYSAEPNNGVLNKRWDALILQILGTVQIGTPVVLSTLLTGLSSVSVYSIYNMVANGLNSILGIFSGGLGAGFGDLIARKEQSKLQHAYMDFEFAYYTLITFVYSVAMVQILPFVMIYTRGVTDANYHQPLLAFLFVFNGFLYNLKTPQGMLVISAGLYKETKWQTTMQAVIAAVGGLLLGYKFGLIGIMSAMCLSNLYRDIDLLFFIPKHVTHLKPWNTMRNIIVSVAEMVVIVVLCLLIPWKNDSFLHWICNSIAISFISLAVILAISFVFNRKQIGFVYSRIRSMFNR